MSHPARNERGRRHYAGRDLARALTIEDLRRNRRAIADVVLIPSALMDVSARSRGAN